MRTYNDIYIDGAKRLKKAGIEAASLEARLLLAFAADKTTEELLRDIRLYPGDEIEQRAELFFDRRISGEPAAYILGEWEFCGLSFEVNPNVLIPRMDTELLPEALLSHIGDREKPRILDLCAGSGCIGLTAAARRADLTAVLADIDERALMVCRRNAMRHRLTSRVYCVRADALDMPSGQLGSFDAIVCNPPYIASAEIDGLDISVKDHEPRSALDGGEDGLDFYRSICAFWSGLLRGGGILIFECGEGQSGKVKDIARAAGLTHIQSAMDTLGIERAVIFRK
ncbi:MAG: peptide chain release factor N(5)-glutamine methyltransferase [Oscillospiraceae bacterium]|nr:peptide chain release factor N(5)-glutamine methyltransferase [Oscillospiraceae bacterium]